LRDRGIITTIQDSKWRTLVNNYKRFGSKEISNARLKVSIGSNEFELHTDPEGYFKLYHGLEHPLPEITGSWRKAGIHVIEIPERKVNRHFSSELLIPPREAQFGIISDIDDTVLKTDVTSLLKLKLIYHTLFKNAATRKAFLEATAFYRSLEYGTLSHPVNPVFYVSNSPWNLYDLLDEFLELNHLPKGPILLRDFGLPYEEVEKGYVGHKHSSILQILETFPTLPFILIGDSGEKDPYIYQAVAESHPDRIAAIYIRDVRSSRRRRKLQRYIDDTKADITVVENYAQAAKHAATRQLLSPLKFEQYRSPRST
jgi:phosphatidate phosphatase APP1